MKTHAVIDLVYTEDEGNMDFVGTEQECYDYISEQCKGGNINTYQVVPLTNGDFMAHNPGSIIPGLNNYKI